jgi:two-component system chemotaxis response regulator CheY
MEKDQRGSVPRILNVGQCGFDHGAISGYLVSHLGADVARADTPDEAEEMLRAERYDLVLVNRLLDLDGSSGLELIRALKESQDPALADIPVMLVSDYPEAQEAARELGAAPGFGKSDLHSPVTLERIKGSLAR